MSSLQAYLPLLIPAAVIELALAAAALIHVLRHNAYRFGSRVFWAILVVVVGFVGPILYFTLGKKDD